jgi:hypothetical protein
MNYDCGPPLPAVTDDNVAEIEAYWRAYVDQWMDTLRDYPASWWEVARTFKHMARTEEFLAAALKKLAEGTS